MDTSLIESIPNVIDFLKYARDPENITIEKINNTFMYYLSQNILKDMFKIDITNITKGYKLNEVKNLVLPLFEVYKAKGYCIKYKIYQKEEWIYSRFEKRIYLKVKSYSFTIPQTTEQPPPYTELNIASSNKLKKKSWFWFG